MARRWSLPLLALCLLLALACARLLGRGEAASSRDRLPTAEALAPTRPSVTQGAAQRSPVELRAEAIGNAVRFQIVNNAVPQLYVGPENFALISPGSDEPLLATDERVVRHVVSVTLARGEGCTGEIIFLPVESAVGHRLLFNTNQLEQHFWAADITAAEPPTPAP